MKKRIAKKHARDYMDGRKQYSIREELFTYDTDGNWCIKYLANMPYYVLKYVHLYAYRTGWSGCHWDAPDIVDIYYPGEKQ
jgi:hypothetical protein